MEVRVLSSALALLLAAILVGGCSDEPRKPARAPDPDAALAPYLPPPPPGFRYVPAKRPAAARQFIAKLRSDFDADAVAIRNVWQGDHFFAGVVVLRTRRPLSVKAIGEKALPNVGYPPIPLTLNGKHAHILTRVVGPPETAVIDTVGRIVIVVTGPRAVTKVAKAYVR